MKIPADSYIAATCIPARIDTGARQNTCRIGQDIKRAASFARSFARYVKHRIDNHFAAAGFLALVGLHITRNRVATLGINVNMPPMRAHRGGMQLPLDRDQAVDNILSRRRRKRYFSTGSIDGSGIRHRLRNNVIAYRHLHQAIAI